MSEKIDDIIDEKAFQQLERLLRDLGIAQAKFVDLATSAASMNAELGKVQGFRELESAISKTTAATEKMQEQGRKVEDTLQKTAKAEKELVEATKGRLLGVQEETKLLNSLTGSLDQNIRNQIRLKAELKAVQDQQKELNKAQTSGVKMTGEMAEKAAELAKSETELKTAIAANNLEIRRAAKEANAAESSYEEMSSRLDRLRAAYKSLSAEERNNVDIGGALLASIQEYDAELKNIDATMGVHNRNVGNYTESVTDAIDATGLFSRQIAFLRGVKEKYVAGAKLATVTTNSFKSALISTGIGAVLVLLGGLIAFLTKTERGMDLVAKATAAVSTFVGVFVDALSTLGEQLFDNILPALKGLGQVIAGIITLDVGKIKDGFNATGEALKNIEPINLVETTKAAIAAAKAAADLEEQLDNLNDAEARLDVTRAQTVARIDELREIVADETKTLRERKAASDEAYRLEEEQAAQGIAFLRERLRIQTEINGLTKSTEEDLQKERDIQIKIAEAESETAKRKRKFMKENQKLQEEANKQSEERRKKEEEQEQALNKAFFDLEASRIKRSIDRNKAVVDDEKLSFEDRLSNLEQFQANQIRLLELESANALSQKGLLADDITRIEEETEAKINEVKTEAAAQRERILLQQLDRENKARVDSQAVAIGLIEKQRDEELDALNQSFAAGEINQQEYNNRRIAIQREYTRRAIQEEIRGVEELMAVNRARRISVADQERQLAALKLRLSQETADAQIQDINRVAEEEQRLRDLKQQFAQEAGRLAISLVQSQFAAEEEKLKFSAAASEEQKNRELERINETVMSEEEKAVRISQVEQRAAREREAIELRSRQLRIRQAEFEKLANVAGIISNTALAIVKQLAATPLPAGFPLVATIGAIGAVQLGQALAVKIPRFEKGTKSAPGGLALTDERGAELYIEPSGNTFLGSDSGPTLRYLKKGTTVIPADETREIMAMSGLASVTGYGRDGKADTDKIVKAYERGAAEIKKAVLSKRQASTVINKSGIHYIYRTGNSYQEYLNRNL